jgi:hypothetical protein
MNADELADELNGRLDHKAANMILKQQAEIEALKQIIDANNLNQNIGQFINSVEEITNEEISNIRDEFFAPDGCNIYTFARALLKKASEI